MCPPLVWLSVECRGLLLPMMQGSVCFVYESVEQEHSPLLWDREMNMLVYLLSESITSTSRSFGFCSLRHFSTGESSIVES